MAKYRSKMIFTEEGIIDGFIEVENGKIANIDTGDTDSAIDLGGNMIIPGIIDTHNHATKGYSPSGKDEKERSDNLLKYLKALASVGVTGVFPSLFSTVADVESLDELKTISKYVGKSVDGAKCLGINFEGPFLNRVGEKGKRSLPKPVDMEYIKKCVELSDGKLRLMGIAPELPGSREAIEFLTQKGIVVAFTHSDSSSKEAFESFNWGVSVSTHTCNVMVGIHHRDVGGLGAVLLDERVKCELICDGAHVCNDMLKLVIKLKGQNNIMLISDSSRFVGAPMGTYKTATGTYCIDSQGRVLDENGSLNGSSKPVLYGIMNLTKNVGIEMTDAVNMATINPARKYGFDRTKGSLKVGKDADFVIITPEFDVISSFSEGRKIFDCKTDVDLLSPQLLNSMILYLKHQ